MPSPRIVTVIINSERPDRLVEFWRAFFQTEVQFSEAGITWLKSTGEGGVNVGIQQVEQKLGGHTEIHLDIAVDDLDGSQAVVEELGGSLVTVNRLGNGFEWRVMHDPDGNEFCIFVHE
jgi:predicted enzyme related to lactoylglutathione lyase